MGEVKFEILEILLALKVYVCAKKLLGVQKYTRV